MTPLFCQLVDSSERTLFCRQYGNRKLEITWEQNSGILQGVLHEDGKAISVTLSGLPKRRVAIEELPLVRNYLEGAVVRLHDRHIDIWPRLLGGAKRKNENAEKFVLFISYDSRDDSSRNAVNGIKEEIEKGMHSSIVFKEEPEGAEQWQKFIREETQKADLVLLYVTKQYLKSDFCLGRIFKAMQVLGDDWAKKMRIICDSEMQELLKTSEAWFQYLNECADFWEKEHETIEKGFKDSLTEVQLALASEREYLYYNRAAIPFFIQGLRERKRCTVEELKKTIPQLIGLKRVRVVAEESSSHLPEICKDIPLLPTFTGRKKLLRQMEENLKLTEKEKKIHKTKVIVLSGLGGVGKTQLAAKFIEGHLKHYNLVWTFDAKTDVMLQESYRELAQELKLFREDEKAVPPEEILARVNRWLKAPSNHGWLLYFDNVDSLEIVQPKSLPQHGGQILITSRHKTHWENFYPVIEVQEFEREESNNLLIKIIPEGKQEGQVNALAEKLGDFPLALDQAGSFIKNNVIGLTITDYLGYFQGDHRAIWEAEQEEATNKLYPATVAMTWKITMDYIKEKFPNAAKALNLCAYLNSTEIPLKWLIDWWKEKTPTKGFQLLKELNDLVKPLVDFSLLRQQEAQKMLSVHQLVQLVTQDNLSEDEKEEFIIEGLKLIKGRFDAYHDDDPKTWGEGRKCMPHAISVTNHAKKGKYLLKNTGLKKTLSHTLNVTDEITLSFSMKISYAPDQGGVALLFHQMATYARRQGNAFKAKKYHTQALEIFKSFFGESHPSVADTLNNLGNAWSDLGEKKKAIEYYEKALEIFKSFLGESHPSVADTLNNLGTAWSDLGEKKKAIEYYEKALKMKKAFLGESHPSVADILNNLGAAWSELGEKEKAIEFYEKALEMTKAFLGESHPSVAETLNNLGTAWSGLGEKKKAIEFFEKALEMKKAFLGESHPSVAETLNNLGLARSDLGEKKQAIEFYEKALEMKKAFLGTHHPKVAETLGNLGTAWSDLGKKKKAIEFFEKALEIFKAFYGDHHPSVAETLNNLGATWNNLGENKKAIEFFEKALEMRKAFYGDHHLSVADTLNNLGTAWSDLGEKKQAIEYFEKTLEMEKAVLGDSHPSVADTLDNLGTAWSELGKNKKAIEFFEKALEMKKAVLGDSHPSVAETLDNLGTAWSELGKNKKAIEFFEKALEMKKAVLGDSHPSVAETLDNLGTAWSELGEEKKAIEFFEKALEMKKAVLGNSHPSVADTLDNLGIAGSNLGENKKAIELYEQALEMKKAVLGESHPSVADTLNNLEIAWSELGEKKQAIEYCEQGLKIRKQLYGENHQNVAQTLYDLANNCYWYHRHNKAIDYYSQSLLIYESLPNYGENHPKIADILNMLAYSYSALGKHQKAMESLKKAKRIYKIHHGKNHSDYINILDSLAEICHNAQNYSQSLAFAEKGLKICEEVFKDGNRFTHLLLHRLGNAHFGLKDFPKAQEYQQQALTLAEKLNSNESDSDKAAILLALGNTQRAQNDLHASLDSLQKARDLFIQIYSQNDSDVAKCHYALGKTYQALQQQKKALDSYTQAYQTALSSLPEDHPDLLKYKESLKPTLTSSS